MQAQHPLRTSPHCNPQRHALVAQHTVVPLSIIQETAGTPKELVDASVEDLKDAANILGKRTSLGQYLAFSTLLTIAVGGSFAFSPRSPLPLPRMCSQLAPSPTQCTHSLSVTQPAGY